MPKKVTVVRTEEVLLRSLLRHSIMGSTVTFGCPPVGIGSITPGDGTPSVGLLLGW